MAGYKIITNTMVDTLQAIGTVTQTDKATVHKFCDFYERFFGSLRFDSIALLEIGILRGESLKMWDLYFPAGLIYGIDYINEYLINSYKIKSAKADQADRFELGKAFPNLKFNIIVDDGGHKMNQQQISFGTLFNQVVSTGFYVIEDLHTSTYDNYRDGLPYETSTLYALEQFQETGICNFHYLTQLENEYLTANIQYVEILHTSPNSITSMIIKK
jgi:hypothetical protein